MNQPLGGFGQGLPAPQNLFPSELDNSPYDFSTNLLSLPPGDVVFVPAGFYQVGVGEVSFLQFLDPVTNTWRGVSQSRSQIISIRSDGANYRLANLTACPIAAVVANGGTGYTQSTLTITANVGGSTWQGIVGGSLSVVSVVNAGKNYTMPPLVAIPDGPLGLSVPATGAAVLASGTVASVSLINVGAGYVTAPTPLVLLPNPADPNLGSITNATITLGLINAGKITAALCTNNGASLATISALTLTAAGGAGSGATITPVVLQCLTGFSVTAGGGGYGTATELTTIGGQPASVSAIGNPAVELTGYRPRPALAGLAVGSGAVTSITSIFDNGLFVGAPTPLVLGNAVTTTAATVTLTLGGINDTVLLQPGA
jgi:hypothetical protein